MLATSYFVLSGLMIVLCLFILNRSLARCADISNELIIKWVRSTFIIFLGWFVYLFVLEGSGVLLDLSLPPRFVLLVLGPLIILFVYFYRKFRGRPVVRCVPKFWPVLLQSFRIFVEIIIYYTVLEGVLPEAASFLGYNYDIVVGMLAPLMAYGVYQQKVSRRLMRVWNIWGILMIFFVALIVVTSLFFPGIWGASRPLVSLQFIEWPYFLLPGILAPLGIFLHVFSMAQWVQPGKEN